MVENTDQTTQNEQERRETRERLRLLFQSLNNSGNNGNRSNDSMLLQLLSELIPEDLQNEWFDSLADKNDKGCKETFVSSLPRVSINDILKQEIIRNPEIKAAHLNCSICYCKYTDDDYPLIAQLPHCGHHFDFECISIWLSKNETCPICRDNLTSHKEVIDTSNVELEEDWGMYG
ncbi:hypothetical protein TPHA_0A03990 [Tetrapisispora phaffii CBS 4417]|uniref:RING-type domain-containing protein n=1 Tax=Tetrapisispora phaffii (strain ATCC 24235 / CBS 4417 / NBRC 1672 / NRRL Y-8282 / UCD 70-5) TaxID=1071381 RepID=G8BNJ7_TETPH|nr:hypothetical protein TPHA_0A03990 [Tetrapisispora phaffii CBS 4417]CCE61475.1 hypothetical protein TPHA_0A03990 [Tetrapisispora phaffii CBS 4417]